MTTELSSEVSVEINPSTRWNIRLNKSGLVKVYPGFHEANDVGLAWLEVRDLNKLANFRPLQLTTDRETRLIMRKFIDGSQYEIEPAARVAIESSLAESEKLSVPIMPCTLFETVAYAEELKEFQCIKSCQSVKGHTLQLTAGKSYKTETGVFPFMQMNTRRKVHYNEETGETYSKDHRCLLSGRDRYIQIRDDAGRCVKFMDRPMDKSPDQFDEHLLWEYFQKPEINTVAEAFKSQVDRNMAALRALEEAGGYKYYDGQREYLSRVAVKDCALVAAETGCGKSLCAISLIALKSPRRALIIAPRGTVKSSDEDDEDDESGIDASQWCKEISRFLPYVPVFEIFRLEDYQRICSLNGGSLPEGAVYISYWESMFSNGAKEQVPAGWDDFKLNKYLKSKHLAELPIEVNETGVVLEKRQHCNSVGEERNGIRCVLEPCLATMIGGQFDMVILDECQKVCNLDSLACNMAIRLQPKYRYAMSATPIPNVISNIFSLIGWLAVPGWHMGKTMNAAFPYAREDIGKFNSTFLSLERDLTQETDNRKAAKAKNESWSGKCIKESPIISSPARLLKILKPTMAFISKKDCSDGYIPPKITDVRVPMGKEQAQLYAHFLDRGNVEASDPRIRAAKQICYLRNICADPKGFTHGGPVVYSNMNPKVISILELVRDIVARRETVVIINSRVGLTSTIHEKLLECGITASRIDSTMPADEHSKQANLFKQGKTETCFMGLRCAAAYSFDQCPNLIIGSIEFAPGPFSQAVGRIDRVTNKVVKNIYTILVKDSYEEIMWDSCCTKDDAARICLRGERVPREFLPVDASSVMADVIDRFNVNSSTPESECEKRWPQLRTKLIEAAKYLK